MVLYEYDEELHIKNEKDISRKEGLKEGLKKGEHCALINLVCRKLQKGKSPERIADELDLEPVLILPICETAKDFAPDYDCEKIYNLLHNPSRVSKI